MFEENVYSDPCLILTGTVEKVNNRYVFTVDQTFTYDDFKKAIETRIIKIRYIVNDDDAKTLFGTVSIGDVVAYQNAPFIMVRHFATSTNGTANYGLTPDENNKWSGYIQVS